MVILLSGRARAWRNRPVWRENWALSSPEYGNGNGDQEIGSGFLTEESQLTAWGEYRLTVD